MYTILMKDWIIYIIRTVYWRKKNRIPHVGRRGLEVTIPRRVSKVITLSPLMQSVNWVYGDVLDYSKVYYGLSLLHRSVYDISNGYGYALLF